MGSSLRRRNGVFWFRRRVPQHLVGMLGRAEVNRTLSTSCYKAAQQRAREAWLHSEKVFADVARRSLTEEQAALVIERLRTEPAWASETTQEIANQVRGGDLALADVLFRHASDILPTLPEQDQAVVLHALERINGVTELQGARVDAKASGLEARLHELRSLQAHLRETDALEQARAAGRVTARATTDLEVERRVQQRTEVRVAGVLEAEPDAAPESGPRPASKGKPAKGPSFSALENAFLADKARGPDGYSGQTTAQVRATFRLLAELIGDRPVGSYTGTDAGRFLELAYRMPASHGKGGRVNARNAIQAADAREKETGEPVLRLSPKTVKRHFSALSQYWRWLLPREHVEKNVFAGFSFAGTAASRRRRSDWSDEQLLQLFQSDWYGPEVPADSAQRWLPALAMLSGLRLDEAARLRPAHDIVERDGIVLFHVQEHPDGWMPKTEASVRFVPVHPLLVEFGFMRLVERRREEMTEQMWPELRHMGPDDKLSAEFSRRFGKMKDGLGLPKTVVFHSFRHNVSTILRNTETPRNWIDFALGHENSERGSAGDTTYLKRIGAQNLVTTISRVTYSPTVVEALKEAMARGTT